jgi:hypothetical protein
MRRSDDKPDAELSDSQLRVLREHAARLAAISATRWEDAMAAENYLSAGYWSVRYARAAARCMALGKLLRAPEGVLVRAHGHALGDRGS